MALWLLRDSAGHCAPLYLNAFGGLHLWTTDANESNVLTTTAGWVDEGIAGYVVALP